MKYLQNKIWKINKRGGGNKKGEKGGGGQGPTKNPKINKQGVLLFGTGEYCENKQNQNLNKINLEAALHICITPPYKYTSGGPILRNKLD